MADLPEALSERVREDCNRYCTQQWAWARERWRLYEEWTRLHAEGRMLKDIAKGLKVSAARLSQIRDEMNKYAGHL